MERDEPKKWACGITTVPSRADTLLKDTVRSLAAAGFPPPVLYVDGLDPKWAPPCEDNNLAGVVIHEPPVSATQNWMLGLLHLWNTQPTADYYAMFEDDLLATKNLREYLERCKYPEKGYWNLLTHPMNLVLSGGLDGWHKSNQLGKGAVGLVFSPQAVRDLITNRVFLDRPRLMETSGAHPCADGMVCNALVGQLGYTEYTHCPTLLEHTGGEQSTLGHKYGRMIGFRGEDYDILQVLENGHKSPAEPSIRVRSMNEVECLKRMVPPSQIRPTVWRGGVMQIHVTRACDLSCFNCTQGSQFGGKPVMITCEEMNEACKSLKGYWGVVGMFGGNPAVHPDFEELCAIMADHFPKEQRGLWCNNPRGKGKVMRRFFDPGISNLNVHKSQEAFDEFKRDWPECNPFGLKDSHHSPPWGSMLDLPELPWPDGTTKDNTEANRLKLIAKCDINQLWSAMICKVPGKGMRGFFCEIAGAQAMLKANDPEWPDTGTLLEEGWWTKDMAAFAPQVRQHCHRCIVPLKLKGQLAVDGEFEQITDTYSDIAKPKDRNRPIELIQIESLGRVGRTTDYVQNAGV